MFNVNNRVIRVEGKLSFKKETKELIKKYRESGMSIVEISNKLGMKESTVRNLMN